MYLQVKNTLKNNRHLTHTDMLPSIFTMSNLIINISSIFSLSCTWRFYMERNILMEKANSSSKYLPESKI